MQSTTPVELHGLAVFPDGRVFRDGEEMHYSPMCRGKYRGVNANGKTYYVHRLVAEAFIPNPEGKPDVAHIDGDGTNNHVSNLRWATESENMADKLQHGTATIGSRHGNAKLTEEDVREIRQLRAEKVHVDEIAAMYGVSRWTIYDVCNPKRCWKHLK